MKKLLVLAMLVMGSLYAQEEIPVQGPAEHPFTYDNLEKDLNKRMEEKKLVTEPSAPHLAIEDFSGATAVAPTPSDKDALDLEDFIEETDGIQEHTFSNDVVG